ncbi:MAG: hypothetical protein P8Y99_12125 [Calditrichaceae bacterium]
MSTIVNLYHIIVRTRIMIFLFILILFLDALILFYYPQYKTEQDIQSQKRSIAKYLNITSEIIADKSDTNTLSNDQIISYLKYNSDIIYIIIPDSNASVIFPSGFIAVEQISSLRFNEIIELNGQNLVNIRIIPPLKYHFEFKEIFLGINAREILENKNEYYNFAFIVIAISFILLCIFIALYILDFYKFQNKVKSDHLKLDNLNISEDNILHENGILQLKSRLIHRKRELKSINNILAATITSQRNFIKVISHDLKAPLR